MHVRYAGICYTGLVRKNNEDNYLCGKKHLNAVHGNDVCSGIIENGEILAVFDGMGGGNDGEIASYIAAETFGRDAKEDEEGFDRLIDLVYEANEEICAYASEKRLGQIGTTAAGVLVDQERMYSFNLGDSRVYAIRNGVMEQLSHDHVIFRGSRRMLTQCLGIPQEEFMLSPEIGIEIIKPGDRYLLCSDGLTDMLDDESICTVINEAGSADAALEKLKNETERKGAIDNMTVILCEVTE